MARGCFLHGDIIALHDYRALYFAIPKVANSSMKAICADLIRDQLGDEFTTRFWRDRWRPRIFRDPQARAFLRSREILLTRHQLAKYADYWKFCLVRNPWDRIVSCWKQKVEPLSHDGNLNGVAQTLAKHGYFQPGMSFDRFMRSVATIPDKHANPHFRGQWTFVTDQQGELVVDFAGRMEAIDEDLGFVFNRLGIPAQHVPHLLKCSRKPYMHYFSPDMRDLTAKRYAEDVRMFHYEFDDAGTPSTD